MKKVELYSLISGAVFLISGIAKSISISDFSQLIANQYGFGYLHYLAPLIVLGEVFLGLMLVFQVYSRKMALVSLVLLVAFTLVYIYGLIFNGVEDCGCFGNISVLNTYPAFTLVRNAILAYLLIVIWRKGDDVLRINKWNVIVTLALMSIVAYMSGYSFRNLGKRNSKSEKYVADAIGNTNLKDFITASKDSTYLVFAFTYRCPHCLNSIENLKQYESTGVVDKVIGLTLTDSVAERVFKENFKPDFLIKDYSSKELFRLTNSFPRAYYIRNDSVIMEMSGELPCSYVFRSMIKGGK